MKTIVTEDVNVNRIQDNVKLVLDQLGQVSIVNGQLLTGIQLTASGSQVPHRLGHKHTGWIVTYIDANATIYENKPNNGLPDSSILLYSSAPCIVNLWVF
jgi:hypothetical protein